MCHPGAVGYYIDPVLWALALSLSTLAGIWSFFAFRRRGPAAGLRGVAVTLLPLAALLTGTLTLVMRIIDAVAGWAAGLVFSPLMWAGLVLLALSLGLFAVARVLPARAPERAGRSGIGQGAPAATPVEPVDAEMAEIEALLRRRGIG